MYWPILTNHKLEKNECHVLVIHHQNTFSNKTNAKEARQEFIQTILKKYTLYPFRIETTGTGKPFLDSNELHFNISHSRNVLLIAISYFPVGVDFEFIKKKDYIRFSNYFWEKDLISSYPEHMQALAFFQAWTQTEAWVKFHGETIFNHAAFSPTQLLSRQVIKLSQCNMVSFMPMVNTIASLCYDSRIQKIKLKHLDWSACV